MDWQSEAGTYRLALDKAVKLVEPMPGELEGVILLREKDVTELSKVLDIPTFRAFGARLEKYLSFQAEVNLVIPKLPNVTPRSPLTEKKQAENDLKSWEKPVADKLVVVQSHIDQLPLDRSLLNIQALRLPAGLDLEDVQRGLRSLEQLKGRLKLLKTTLNGYEKNRKKLLKVVG